MISLVIPAYNEEKRIANTIKKLYQYMDKSFFEYELIVVNDGSRDKTLEILESFSYPHLKVFTYEQNKGKGGAVKFGVDKAEGDIIFFTDADMPYPAESIKEAVSLFKKNDCEVILGKRVSNDEKGKYPWYRNCMSKVFSMLANSKLKLGVEDTQCGFKAFRKDAAKKIFEKSSVFGWGFDVEIIFLAKKYGYKIERIDVELTHENENSKIHIIRDSRSIYKDLVKVKKNEKNKKYD